MTIPLPTLRQLAEKAIPAYQRQLAIWAAQEHWPDATADSIIAQHELGLELQNPATVLKLLDVCEAADGLSRGTDWNNGTQAGYYRKPLMKALARLRGRNDTDRLAEADLPVLQPLNISPAEQCRANRRRLCGPIRFIQAHQ